MQLKLMSGISLVSRLLFPSPRVPPSVHDSRVRVRQEPVCTYVIEQ